MTANCEHCGMIHQQTCPRIKAIEYHDNGNVKRIEFHDQQPIDRAPISPFTAPNISATGTLICPPDSYNPWNYGRN